MTLAAIFFGFRGLIMTKVFSSLILNILFTSLAIAAPMPTTSTLDKSWQQVSSDEGIVTHRKEIDGSPLVAFRGETVIDVPIAKVANILMDTSRKLEWVHKIVEARDVRQINEYERIEYNHTASGFFAVRDRDFVFHAKATIDRPKNQVHFTLKSVADSLAPETDCVRGSLNESRYVLTSIDGGKKTHIVVEIHADPKGSVPNWLVNIFQKAWPRRTLDNIKKQASKDDVKEHPGIKAQLSS